MGDRERPPVRGTTEIGYSETNVQAAAATMIAHHWRRRTGEGQHVDVSAQECIANSCDTAQQTWDMMKFAYHRGGGHRWIGWRLISCVYPCKDGYVASWSPEDVSVLVEWMEAKGCMDPEEKAKRLKMWADSEASGTTLSQFLSQEELNIWRDKRIPFFANMTQAEIYEGAMKRHFGWGPVNAPRDLVKSIQLAGVREYFVKVEHPELGDTLTYAGAPTKLYTNPFRIRRRAPLIGEHNLEVYAGELGLSKEELTFLKSIKVI
jgi:crotonobetainyl-CoA:carnitine CoA-transferase CaiB-like acyl-CoA transferase